MTCSAQTGRRFRSSSFPGGSRSAGSSRSRSCAVAFTRRARRWSARRGPRARRRRAHRLRSTSSALSRTPSAPRSGSTRRWRSSTSRTVSFSSTRTTSYASGTPPPRRSPACRPPSRRGQERRRRVPGWSEIAQRSRGGARRSPGKPPARLEGREVWLSVGAVTFAEGTVFAFRDLTEERGLEQLKSDFVSTVSHELRTPLAAIYGASRTRSYAAMSSWVRNGGLVARDDRQRSRPAHAP